MRDDKKTIILVDDMLNSLYVNKSSLSAYYRVFTAPSAEKMFVILQKIIPDLILLDIEMPVMNGFEALKKIKSEPRYADIPVIFLTTKSDECTKQQGYKLGASEFLSKPISPSLLLNSVNRILMKPKGD